MSRKTINQLSLCAVLLGVLLSPANAQSPGDQIDLRYWKLTLPSDANKDGKVDEVSVRGLKKYSHPEYF